MVTLREPTLRGDRGERGGETESSDMLVGCGRRGKSSLGDCFEEQPAEGRAQPQSPGSVGAWAFVEPLEAVRGMKWGRRAPYPVLIDWGVSGGRCLERCGRF